MRLRIVSRLWGLSAWNYYIMFYHAYIMFICIPKYYKLYIFRKLRYHSSLSQICMMIVQLSILIRSNVKVKSFWLLLFSKKLSTFFKAPQIFILGVIFMKIWHNVDMTLLQNRVLQIFDKLFCWWVIDNFISIPLTIYGFVHKIINNSPTK